jgi:glycopeptide antibiotics resistance protein
MEGPGQRRMPASAAPGRTDFPGEHGVEPAVRAAYAVAAAVFVGYAVWGSLFPFDFHAVPLSHAAALFWTRWASDAGPWSLTDLLSNVLLFLPIGLLLCATSRGRFRGLTPIAAAAALSVAIEFAQAFVSWRTPSVVDVAAEVAGAACGVTIWRLMSAEFDRLLSAIVAVVRRSTRVEQILLACCAGLAVAWLLPADFTLRPAEIGDKYEHKRLLLPWMPSPDAATPGELAAIGVAAVPVGLAAVVCGCGAGRRRSAASGALIAAMGLIALELIQIPIFSRTTDANELLAALGGSTAGVVAASLIERPRVTGVDWRAMRVTAAVLLWVCVVLAFEWWPFPMPVDASRMQFETTLWSRAPFRWPGSAADVVPGAVLAAMAGAFARPRLDPHFARLQTMLIVGFAGAVFAVCEGGRVALAGGRPTLLSVVFKLSALVAGLYMGSAIAGDRQRGREAQWK